MKEQERKKVCSSDKNPETLRIDIYAIPIQIDSNLSNLVIKNIHNYECFLLQDLSMRDDLFSKHKIASSHKSLMIT